MNQFDFQNNIAIELIYLFVDVVFFLVFGYKFTRASHTSSRAKNLKFSLTLGTLFER